MVESSFFANVIGHVVEIGVLALGYAAYRKDRGKDNTERQAAREKMIETQTRMHTENQTKLEILDGFQDSQQVFNARLQEQTSLLAQQTATLTQMAAGMERRLQMIENRRHNG